MPAARRSAPTAGCTWCSGRRRTIRAIGLPARPSNRHRSGVAWSKSAVRVILTKPRFTGYGVWNKQRKDEVLIDVNNVALGHEAKLRWKPAPLLSLPFSQRERPGEHR